MELILFVLHEPWLSLMNNYWWVLVIVAVILAIRFFYYILLAIAFAIGFFISAIILGTILEWFLPKNDGLSFTAHIALCAICSAYMTYRLHRSIMTPSTAEELREIEDFKRAKSRQKRINSMVEERAGVYCKNCSHYKYEDLYDEWCLLYSHDVYAWKDGCHGFDLRDDLWNATYKEMKAEGAFET